jgi:uncharacterized protein
MHSLLSALANQSGRRPKTVLVVLLVVTVALGAAAGDQSADTELTAFATDSELAISLERVQDEFSAGGASLQVIADAGPEGNILARDGLASTAAVAAQLESAASELPELGGMTVEVSSIGTAVGEGLRAIGIDDLADADDAQLAAITTSVMDRGADSLVSNDVDPEAVSARAGLVVVTFPPSLDEDAFVDVSLALAEQVDGLDPAGLDLEPFNAAILGDALQTESQQEMPRLLLLSMLLIVGILMFQYRTVSDVLIGLVGLVISITWMTGFGVLLGPGYLELIGPFSQMAMIIPVLLVGLGIDYAIHLTSRYREEQSHGQSPAGSARMAVLTVGGALSLATVTTMVGFLTNVFSPMAPIADFGILTAIGVLGSFVVMTTLVPASRHVLDARRLAKGRADRPRRPANALSELIGRTSVIARRVPGLALGVALVVSLGAAAAATQVGTTFSQDDFIPEGSPIETTLDRIESLFSGDLTESTFVVLEGDLAAPAVANAQLDVAAELAEIEGVRTTGDAAQVLSPAGLVAQLAAEEPAVAQAAAPLGYQDGRFAPDADLGALFELAGEYEPVLVDQVVNDDATAGVIAISTNAGQEGARDLAASVTPAMVPLQDLGVATSVTSEPLVLEESLDALTDSQTRGIVITLVAALLLLVSYYGVKERTPLLGLITMIPSIAVVSWVLGTMWVLNISFNVMTAMVASLAIGIGVPFGIHVTHRFLEDRRRYDTVDEAVHKTVTHTGGAMAGSAATTAAGFGVLMLASLTPMQQFGLIVAITILYSFLAAVLVQPSCLKLWAERRARRGDVAELHAHEQRESTERDEREAVGELV